MSKKPRRIVSMDLSEVSLCAKPANAAATLEIAKAHTPPVEFKPDQARAEAAFVGILAAMKSQPLSKSEKDSPNMSNTRTTSEILKARKERDGGTDLDAFNAVKDTREFAEAYDAEERETEAARHRAQTAVSY